jgi:hypothetical protein
MTSKHHHHLFNGSKEDEKRRSITELYQLLHALKDPGKALEHME